MVALDSDIVTIALPAISKSHAAGISFLGWVVIAYIPAAVALFLQTGRLGDRCGRKNAYLAALVTS